MEPLVQRPDGDRRLRQVLHQVRTVDLLIAATGFEGWNQLVTARHRSAGSTSAMIAKFASRPG